MGRPPKKCKEVNPVRQIGRWTEEDWDLIRQAAAKKGLSVAGWARPILMAAAFGVVTNTRGKKRDRPERSKSGRAKPCSHK